jgi:hypothetical protein
LFAFEDGRCFGCGLTDTASSENTLQESLSPIPAIACKFSPRYFSPQSRSILHAVHRVSNGKGQNKPRDAIFEPALLK